MKKFCKAAATLIRAGQARSSGSGRRVAITSACGLAVCLGWPAATPAWAASDDLGDEHSLTQFIVIDNERREARHTRAPARQSARRGGAVAPPPALDQSNNIAILPQLGYDPNVGFIAGGKFSAVNVGASHMNMDIAATQSTGGETEIDATWGAPHLFGSDFIGLVRGQFQRRTRQQFYGLGNNDVGDDELSQHEQQTISARFTLARRLAPHWLAATTIGLEHVHIGTGDPNDGNPSTVDVYDRLPGIHGGYSNPLSLSIIYNDRDDLTRPTQGWNAIGKVSHVGPELGNDFNYTQFSADVRYLHPIISRKNLIGIRLNGQYTTGSGDDLPFYNYPAVGGFDSLEGFNPNRFLGQSRVFARIGYNRLLADFNFRDIWQVRIDGSLFGGAGRVFLDRSRLPDDLNDHLARVAPGLSDKIQFSYGAGLNIALDQALTARLDAGFSGESKGLVYLSFGNAF